MSELHQALSRRAIYPDAPRRVEFRETHISWIYLTDSLVYKIKKPVDFGFCNFTSLDRRRFYCEEEVRLNRRLAPDCYLGVSRIVRTNAGLRLDQEGEIREYAVRMRRLPQERMLSQLLEDPAAQKRLCGAIDEIGQQLARFHRAAEIIPLSRHDDLRCMQLNWAQNFDQTRACREELLAAGLFDRLEQMILGFLAARGELLRQRQERGLVRDGHGDLHCEHICLTTPLRIFDCIEFNPDLRYGDILNDLAFLAMDLRYRGHPLLARRLWSSYCAEIDPGPAARRLLGFYALYRAWVRAKVHLFQAELVDLSSEARQCHRQHVRSYLRLAAGYALPPTLLVCCGLIGSGKSSLAADLAEALKLPLLSSDRLRPAVVPAPETGARYRMENRLAVYRELATRATAQLATGEAVIVDASCENLAMRQLLSAAATAASAPLVFLETRCPDDLIRARLRRRATDPRTAGASEAGQAEYEAQKGRFEPFAGEGIKITVDTGQPRENNVDFVLEELLRSCGML